MAVVSLASARFEVDFPGIFRRREGERLWVERRIEIPSGDRHCELRRVDQVARKIQHPSAGSPLGGAACPAPRSRARGPTATGTRRRRCSTASAPPPHRRLGQPPPAPPVCAATGAAGCRDRRESRPRRPVSAPRSPALRRQGRHPCTGGRRHPRSDRWPRRCGGRSLRRGSAGRGPGRRYGREARAWAGALHASARRVCGSRAYGAHPRTVAQDVVGHHATFEKRRRAIDASGPEFRPLRDFWPVREIEWRVVATRRSATAPNPPWP